MTSPGISDLHPLHVIAKRGRHTDKASEPTFRPFDHCLLACVPASHLAKPAYEAPKMIDNRLISHTKHSSR